MGNRAVRIGLIGTGAWSGSIGNTMKKSQRAVLVTCYDEIPAKARAFSETFGCDQEKSYGDVLERRDIDAVHLATPNALHAEQAILAAQHGKHVFVEKPIANTLPDGEKMIDACREGGVVLMVGHHMRRLKGIRKLKELIDQGALGNLVQIEGNYSQNLGFSLTPGSFRWKGDDSGCPAGSLMTMGIHHADVFHYLMGPVKTVFSYFNRLYIPAPVEDVTATIYRFESGVLGYLGSNYVSPKAIWFYVYGTEANLLCTVTAPELPFEKYLLWWQTCDRDTTVQIFEKGKTGGRDVPIPVGNPILEEIEEFADCIQSGRAPETDGAGALRLIRASIESAQTGRQTTVGA